MLFVNKNYIIVFIYKRVDIRRELLHSIDMHESDSAWVWWLKRVDKCGVIFDSSGSVSTYFPESLTQLNIKVTVSYYKR